MDFSQFLIYFESKDINEERISLRPIDGFKRSLGFDRWDDGIISFAHVVKNPRNLQRGYSAIKINFHSDVDVDILLHWVKKYVEMTEKEFRVEYSGLYEGMAYN
jgi:hypothetical protein